MQLLDSAHTVHLNDRIFKDFSSNSLPVPLTCFAVHINSFREISPQIFSAQFMFLLSILHFLINGPIYAG